MTIKGPSARSRDFDSQEHTIRPISKKTAVTGAPSPAPGAKSTFGSSAPAASSAAGNVGSDSSAAARSPAKSHLGAKFELPPRLDVVYREQSVEDYSDLFADNDSVFDHRVNQVVKKVHHVGAAGLERRRLLTCGPGCSSD